MMITSKCTSQIISFRVEITNRSLVESTLLPVRIIVLKFGMLIAWTVYLNMSVHQQIRLLNLVNQIQIFLYH